jgi:F-type H+-transporting ATPase subunit delta
MSEFRAAYRYALAVIGVAEEIKKLDEVSKDFEFIEKLTTESHEFSMFLKSPVVNQEKKKTTLTEILNGRVTDLTMKFVMILASKGREGLLPEITRQFYKLRDERLGILRVTTTSAVPFKPEQEKSLIGRLEQATKKKIRLSYAIDPALKGGFTVQHEDTVWDASVRHQLEVLRKRFTEGIV